MRVSTNGTVDAAISAEIIQKNNTSINQVFQNMSSLKQNESISEITDENGNPTKQAYQTAVNKMNEFMEYSRKDSKFVFHDGLEKYYVEIVDSKTDKVVKEIPPKELLDAYYEMQKLIGKMFDTKA
ncbi:flagellar biosynthesis protein FlaG [Rummeliibacillus sp. TYF005]|uniref:flagellar protein FlaG n=1 Tax=Rummeliibacillus sp. TYF005 TaxID=2058214 RepID=UPI000F521554|nr:flagellar protein FlaG [Rummeliibacillus sp. TYF005]RPJ96831.1 flagellar biosynthesis protein FlaG [Rummeliibacillus sp. TYF005]